MVTATGSYDPQKQVLVPGRLNDGAKGYWIVSAFAVTDAPVLTGRRGLAADLDSGRPRLGCGSRGRRGAAVGNHRTDRTPAAVRSPRCRSTDAGPGRASAVSVAELINIWNVSSYPGFVAAKTELAGGADVGAAAAGGDVKPLRIGPQPPAQQVNWLNLFYSVEWVVFAGFALFIWWRLVKDDYRRGPRRRPRRGNGARSPHAEDRTGRSGHRTPPPKSPSRRTAAPAEPQPPAPPTDPKVQS